MRWLEPEDVTRYAPADFFPVRGAAAIVPLVADGRVLAVVGYGFAPGVVVGPEERSLVQTLAGQAAQAFDRAQALALAEAANRVKDEFLASVSHEIRTPLTSILGWSSILLKNKTVQDTMVLKGLETIHRAAHAQIKLVDDLLDLARVVSGKLTVDRQRLDIVALVAGAVDIARPNAATKGVTLTSELGHEPVFVDADGDRFQQVVLNLLTNAVKFTDVGGSVTVVLSRTPTVVTLSVCDTGRGIAPDLLPYVFERFRQGEGTSARAGLGLGLAIAKHIVGLHGGTIQASSDGPGCGATFTVKLAAMPDPIEASPGVKTTALTGVRVLVLDDEEDCRDIVAAVLESAGATVYPVDSVRNAFVALDGFRPDVLVSDINMPQEDGKSFVRRLRAIGDERATLPAIALTALPGDRDRADALAAGFTTYVTKPTDPADLVATVRAAAMAGRPPLASSRDFSGD
jgi:signal transduction histidine kinase/CheY-like chemotaxis protein